jgi:signal transduction histidine kinase
MPHHILVVEDDSDIQGYCKTVLESAGFSVDTCGTFQEAQRLYDKRRPDLAILDIGLPDGNGLELLKIWSELPGGAAPILFLTARGDLRTRLECFQAGAQDYLHKPFAAEELLARTKVHLQVKKSHDDLVKRNYELELIARARQDMADMIVHDLKAPLTSIKGTLQLIKSHGLISERSYVNLLENAGSAADFMLLMINDLLDVAQAETTKLKTNPQALELPVLFEKLRSLFAGRSRSMNIELSFAVEPGTEKLKSDQNLIYRILANLIANGMKASTAGGKVEVETEKAGDRLKMHVLDRGPGVPDEEKKKIFEKYVTGHREEELSETGTGLGLAFCRVAADALGGKIYVEDREGGGSRFTLEISARA